MTFNYGDAVTSSYSRTGKSLLWGLACNAYNGILSFGLIRARSQFIGSSKTQLTITRWPGHTHGGP